MTAENMRNIRLTIEYNGSGFAGWQIQDNAPTIQGELEAALNKIAGHRVRLSGSGRTDSGVHALCQTANFKTESTAPLKAFVRGTNSILPAGISVVSAAEADEGFDSRRSVVIKAYVYRIYSSQARSADLGARSWWVPYALDVAKMDRAASLLVGTHDFGAFRSAGCDAAHSVRTVSASRVTKKGRLIEYEIMGNGFLRNMVRIIAGTLMEVGAGRKEVNDMLGLLESRDREMAGPTAPACGLTLKKVVYPPSGGETYP